MTDGGMGGVGSVQHAIKRKILQNGPTPRIQPNQKKFREARGNEIDIGSYHFIPKFRQLIRGEQIRTLSPKQSELLKMLAEHKNNLLPREVALNEIWGSDTYSNGCTMDVYITKLRKYLCDDKNTEIVNIRGGGLRLVAPSSEWS